MVIPMKKVLILSSSPRKGGNSQTLCEQFAKGAQEAGHTVDLISLREKSLHCCTGCLACLQTGACVQKDDAAEIMEKMLAADVIVLATPVYFYSMSAQMKMLIDRTVPVYERLNNKEIYFIITQTDPDKDAMERTIEALRGFTDGCLENPIERGILRGAGLQKVGEAQQSPLMQDAYEMGKQV